METKKNVYVFLGKTYGKKHFLYRSFWRKTYGKTGLFGDSLWKNHWVLLFFWESLWKKTTTTKFLDVFKVIECKSPWKKVKAVFGF